MSASLLQKPVDIDEDSEGITHTAENEAGIQLAFDTFCNPKTPREMTFVTLLNSAKS